MARERSRQCSTRSSNGKSALQNPHGNPRAHTVEDDVTKLASTSSDIEFLIGQSTASDSKLASALEGYKAAVARSEATKECLEHQAQKAAAAETEVQQAQQSVSQVESEAVKDATDVVQGSEGARRCCGW